LKRALEDRQTRRDLVRVAMLVSSLVLVVMLGRQCGHAADGFLRAFDTGADDGGAQAPSRPVGKGAADMAAAGHKP
jgi:hypothetical protein